MKPMVETLGKTQIPYYIKGESPILLIHSGTHGDEYGVIESVRLAIEKYEDRLPDFIYVPAVSPSAVEKRTRTNVENIDLNRNFIEGSNVGEIEANFKIVRGKKFDLVVTFHEDIGPGAKFYLYDNGCGLENSEPWTGFKNEVESLGVELLNGADDPSDPDLNYTFTEGYHYWSVPEEGYQGSSFDGWLTRNGVARKILIPEIPGHLPQSTKNKIVDLFFRYLILGRC